MLPKRFWIDIQNVRQYLDWIKQDMGLKSLNDFYSLSSRDLEKRRGMKPKVMYSASLC